MGQGLRLTHLALAAQVPPQAPAQPSPKHSAPPPTPAGPGSVKIAGEWPAEEARRPVEREGQDHKDKQGTKVAMEGTGSQRPQTNLPSHSKLTPAGHTDRPEAGEGQPQAFMFILGPQAGNAHLLVCCPPSYGDTPNHTREL